MTDHAYTPDDLRVEAARQHKAATEDPDFSGIGERMEGHKIASRGALQWDQLGEGDFDAAQRGIDDLLSSAADVSKWAVDLGADGMEPSGSVLTVGASEKPIARIHFAFAPDLDDDVRRALIEGLAQVIANSL
ncbi:hypothetical protein ACFWP5_32565 [Streptomyces sp. NPDC058469]|uniref:hypothetical protein n=1 Tax=Streptomyces sp. NPDC058469 TaxID=3346514 RepID=UPI0036568300